MTKYFYLYMFKQTIIVKHWTGVLIEIGSHFWNIRFNCFKLIFISMCEISVLYCKNTRTTINKCYLHLNDMRLWHFPFRPNKLCLMETLNLITCQLELFHLVNIFTTVSSPFEIPSSHTKCTQQVQFYFHYNLLVLCLCTC